MSLGSTKLMVLAKGQWTSDIWHLTYKRSTKWTSDIDGNQPKYMRLLLKRKGSSSNLLFRRNNRQRPLSVCSAVQDQSMKLYEKGTASNTGQWLIDHSVGPGFMVLYVQECVFSAKLVSQADFKSMPARYIMICVQRWWTGWLYERKECVWSRG